MKSLVTLACLCLALLMGCESRESSTDNIARYTQAMTRQDGLLPLFYDDQSGKIFLQVNNDSRQFIYYFSLPQGLGSNDIGLDRGQLMDLSTKLVRFEPAGDKLLLRQLNTYYRAVSDNPLEQQSVDEAFASSVLWGFPVVARTSTHFLVDATEFALRDSHGVARRLKETKQGNYSPDSTRSGVYPARTKSFPLNTEIEATVTFVGEEPGEFVQQVAPDAFALSVRMHHSFVALPEPGYTPRKFHPQSGFWSFEYKDYAVPIEAEMTQRFIPRHRLIKKNPGAAMSEAVQPIIYYLDPGTPEPIRTALLEGGSWWNQAFEAAGFKDAFQIKMLPADADPLDVRYNVVQWVHRATRGWSYGYGLTDPRTGEIIKGHVTLGSLRVRQDYLIAQGMTAPFESENADTTPLTDMALARIRQLSAHEIGHTLGIAHNFAASPNDRASVMDYPQPQISLTEDNRVSLTNAYAENIGSWDKRVIQYGYGDAQSSQQLDAFVAQSAQLGFQFITDPDSRSSSDQHPASSLWDSGANAVDELDRVITLRAIALKNFNANALAFGRPYSDLAEILVPVYYYHRYQAEAAGKWLGGHRYDYNVKVNAGAEQLIPVSGSEQRKALSTLLSTLNPDFLKMPNQISALIPPKAYGWSKTRESATGFTGASLDPVSMAEASVNHTLNILLSPERLARMDIQHASDATIPGARELIADTWATTQQKSAQGIGNLIHQRTQTAMLRKLGGLLATSTAPEVKAAALHQLTQIKTQYEKAPDSPQALWLKTVAAQQLNALAPQKDDEQKLPPGSPI